MSGRGLRRRSASRSSSSFNTMPAVRVLGVGVALSTLLVALAAAEMPAETSQGAARQRRSDDYDNLDNFLMGSNDYDNFFLKTAKSVPRIGRRSQADGGADTLPLHVDRRSTDMNELVPSYAGGDHFFLKASKSVPRIGKRNDEFFMKTAKSVPRIGRRSGDGPDDFLLKGKEHSDYLKTDQHRSRRSGQHDMGHRVERRSRFQVEESDAPAHGALGGNDAVLGQQRHRIQRRNYDELMAKAAKTVPRMGKRMHPALDEVGDWGTEQQWPWFRQHDTSPGPYKRANPADSIDLADDETLLDLRNKSPLQHFMWSVLMRPRHGGDKAVPWDSLDMLLRKFESRGGGGGDKDQQADDHDRGHDVVLLDNGEAVANDRWAYSVGSDRGSDKARPGSTGSKEVDEGRFQADVTRK